MHRDIVKPPTRASQNVGHRQANSQESFAVNHETRLPMASIVTKYRHYRRLKAVPAPGECHHFSWQFSMKSRAMAGDSATCLFDMSCVRRRLRPRRLIKVAIGSACRSFVVLTCGARQHGSRFHGCLPHRRKESTVNLAVIDTPGRVQRSRSVNIGAQRLCPACKQWSQ